MKILRAFQVINKDGVRMISSTYNEADNSGNITRPNAKTAFMLLLQNCRQPLK